MVITVKLKKPQMDAEILKNILTKDEIVSLGDEISAAREEIYKTSDEEQLKNVINNKLSGWFALYVVKNCGVERDKIEILFNNLEKELNDIDEIKLSLAFQPSRIFVEKAAAWVRANLSGTAILNFDYNPGILGGAVFSYKGKYYDHSLRKHLEEYFSGLQKTRVENDKK